MTSITIDPTDVSAALIAFIKADVSIAAIFGDEIREMDWMSADFVYPSLRIDSGAMPEMNLNGNCKGRWLHFTSSVYIFVNELSSKNCQKYMGMVGKLFQNAQIQTAKIMTMPLNIGYIHPISDGTTLWRGEVTVIGRLIDV